ncbi:MAG: gluconate 2-dehydrogenase subunit 3 family protein [Sedimentitalea sp.]|uniref:gluconate 2-dehydrogenase subunit 3 family protein n=1 Tax=Sedimentitalea sp. TaxID=2048915 RepID=UPI00326796EF
MWATDERVLLDAILDVLIPPGKAGRIPGAGELGVADFIATADAYARDPMGAARAVIAAVGHGFLTLPTDQRVAALKQIEATHPRVFATLVQVTYMGYYRRPDTRPLFGVAGHPVHPQGYVVARESDALMADLTAPVRARGRVYRDAT